MDDPSTPLLYGRLAEWWPLLSAPEEYEEEAELYARLLTDEAERPVRDVLELGCGGGNNASHMKRRFAMTLSDVSPEMLAVSRALNPQCEHFQGDMRTIRLGRRFDAVFVHDAIDYMTTEDDLAAALATVAEHCKRGGSFVVAPDHMEETFSSSTSHGGHDGDTRSLRYLEWTHPREPGSSTCRVTYAYVLREGDHVSVELDQHVNGVFPRATWTRLLDDAGLDARLLPHTFSDGTAIETVVGRKR